MDSELAGVTACDVLIMGSGAAALCAAITAKEAGLDVLVAEKTEVFGGTSAWSGGWLWVPRNPFAIRAGIVEDREAPRRYLRALLGNRANDPRLEVFLENGPEMITFLDEIGAMEWRDGNAVPDFYDHDGAMQGGRSVTAAPIDGRALGPLIHKLRPPRDILTLGGMAINSGADMAHFFNATRALSSTWHVAKRLTRHAYDLLSRGRSMQLVGGNALIARLLKAAAERDVILWSQSPVTTLKIEAGRVTGATVQRNGAPCEVRVRRGIILAAGGFPHDPARQAGHFSHLDKRAHASAAPTTNTGDGLRLAEAIGAGIDMHLAEPAAWAPVSQVPDGSGRFKNFPHLVDRGKPGFLAVDSHGRRFVNEAVSYHDFIKVLLAATPENETPEAWLICDHRAQRQFGIGWAKPFPFPVQSFLRSGYLKRGRSVRALAAECGLPAEALEQTILRFNASAREGRDPEFHRGETPYNRASGWAKHRGPNPSLAPLDRGPFYAVKLIPGSLGTFAGIRTAADGQVLSTDGAPIGGLYAIGNDAASVMGGHYPSGGITLGPGMSFGYVVARRLAGLPIKGLAPDQTHDASDTSPASRKEA